MFQFDILACASGVESEELNGVTEGLALDLISLAKRYIINHKIFHFYIIPKKKKKSVRNNP